MTPDRKTKRSLWVEKPYDPLNKDDVITLFSRFGLSSVYFFTIPPKINTDKQLPSISQIVRSLRDYADCMLIVRGMSSGRHYHGLLHLKPGKELKYFTKFRLNKRTLVDVKENLTYEDVESKDKTKYYNTLTIEKRFNQAIIDSIQHHDATSRFIVPVDAWTVCRSISSMISLHFKLKTNAVKAREKNTKKSFHIGGVYDYLMKNLRENESSELYVTHQLINNFPRKIRRKDIISAGLNSGIVNIKYDHVHDRSITPSLH